MSKTLFAILTLALCPALLAADEKKTDGDKKRADGDRSALFDRLDANKDGQIAKDEVPADKRRLLDRLLRVADKNKDGQLSRQEFTGGLTSREPVRPSQTGPRRDRPMFNPQQLFNRIDQNGDGKIVLGEVPARRRKAFERIITQADKNKDGGLSLEEFRGAFGRIVRILRGPQPAVAAGRGAAGSRILRAIDRDGDGAISKSEIAAAAESLAKLDRNGDGRISQRELAATQSARRPGADRFTPETLVRAILRADRNGDKKISKDEAPQRLKQRFDEIDANSDGVIDTPELKRYAERVAKRLRRNRRPAGKTDAPPKRQKPRKPKSEGKEKG